MHNPTRSTQPLPKHTNPKPRIYHRLIPGTRSTMCGKVMRAPKELSPAEVKTLTPSQVCPRCKAALQLDKELTRHLEENAALPLIALKVLGDLDDPNTD